MKSQLFFLVLCIVGSAMLVRTNEDDEFTMLQKVMGTTDNMEPAETLATLRKLQTIYAQQLNANKDDIVAKVTGALVKGMLELSEIKEENCNEAFFKGLDERIENSADQSKHNVVKYLRDCKAKQLKRCASSDGTNEEGEEEEVYSEQASEWTNAEANRLKKTLLYTTDNLTPDETLGMLRRIYAIHSDRSKADEDDIEAEVIGGLMRDWLEPSEIRKENCNEDYIKRLDENIEHQARLSRHNIVRYFKDCKAKLLKVCGPALSKEEGKKEVDSVSSVNVNLLLNTLYSEESEMKPEDTLWTIEALEAIYHAKSTHDNKDFQAKIRHKAYEGLLDRSKIRVEYCNPGYILRLDELISEQTEKRVQNLKNYYIYCRARTVEECKSMGKPIALSG